MKTGAAGTTLGGNVVEKEKINQCRQYLNDTLEESISVKKDFLSKNRDTLIAISQEISQTISRGGKILIFGNGGSAADSQHMAAEMIGKMLVKRRPLPALALTTDSSNLTALSNDFNFDNVFEMQIEALAKPEDLVIAITTSGKSINVLRAVRVAKEKGCKVVGLTGGAGGDLKSECDFLLCAEAGKNSSRIQESHIFAIHSLVDLLDRFFLEAEETGGS